MDFRIEKAIPTGAFTFIVVQFYLSVDNPPPQNVYRCVFILFKLLGKGVKKI